MPRPPIAGVILCGGQSRRMGRVVKANLSLAGKTLLQHVIGRVSPQVARLMLSVESHGDEYEYTGLEQVPDPRPGHGGPLGGLLSALEALSGRHDWLLLAPCDAPFLPTNLGERLYRQAVDTKREACIVRYLGAVQPTFSLWNRSLLPRLREAVLDHEMAGFKQFLDAEPQALLDWEPTEPSPFFNINDAEALARAKSILSSQGTLSEAI